MTIKEAKANYDNVVARHEKELDEAKEALVKEYVRHLQNHAQQFDIYRTSTKEFAEILNDLIHLRDKENEFDSLEVRGNPISMYRYDDTFCKNPYRFAVQNAYGMKNGEFVEAVMEYLGFLFRDGGWRVVCKQGTWFFYPLFYDEDPDKWEW